MKVAVIQMNSAKSIEKNLRDAHLYVQEAAKKGARMVVLPEMFLCMGVKNQSDLARQFFPSASFGKNKLGKGRLGKNSHGKTRLFEVSLAENSLEKDSLVEGELARWAREYHLYIVAGSLPYPDEEGSDKVYASSFLISPEGTTLTRYDKIHLFDVTVGDEKGSYRESDTFLPGDEPKVFQVDDALLGMSVCYDLRFPELYQFYQAKSCNVITVPSAFTYQTGQKHWEILLRARAIETQSFILAANQVGTHEDGRKTWGQSMIISPEGEILTQVEGDKPGVALADLDFENQQKIQSAMPLIEHKRLLR